ncbi:MAG: hypothetical protein WKF37_02535 [Bryobacteraceae bacterium]
MTLRMCAFFAITASGFAADRDFNGRWDITVPGENRGRAWWLEVKGAEGRKPNGSFIGAPGGGLEQTTSMSIHNGELTFTVNRKFKEGKNGVYKASLVKGKLEGRLEIEGEADAVKWTGVRAPVFKPLDITHFKPGSPIEIFNGRDLSNWHTSNASRPIQWTVANGILKNAAGVSDIVTNQSFRISSCTPNTVSALKVTAASDSGHATRYKFWRTLASQSPSTAMVRFTAG